MNKRELSTALVVANAACDVRQAERLARQLVNTYANPPALALRLTGPTRGWHHPSISRNAR